MEECEEKLFLKGGGGDNGKYTLAATIEADETLTHACSGRELNNINRPRLTCNLCLLKKLNG